MAGAGLDAGPGVTDRADPAGMTGRVRPGAADVAMALSGVVLAGATAFGLWHVVVGGLLNGNPRAAAFGVALALAAGIPLLVCVAVVRRRRLRRRHALR